MCKSSRSNDEERTILKRRCTSGTERFSGSKGRCYMTAKSCYTLISFFGLCFLFAFSGCSNTCGKDLAQEDAIETTVVNLETGTYDEYIGRRSEPYTHMLTAGVEPGEEGWLGNPHPIGWCKRCREDHTRAECIRAFKEDFYEAIGRDGDFRNKVLLLKGKRLGCYCKPKECHGDVIKEYIESQQAYKFLSL